MADLYSFATGDVQANQTPTAALESAFATYSLNNELAPKSATAPVAATESVLANPSMACDSPSSDSAADTKVYLREDGYHVMCDPWDLRAWSKVAPKLAIFLYQRTESDVVHFHFGTMEDMDRYWSISYHMLLVALRNTKAKTIAICDCVWGAPLTQLGLACSEIRLTSMGAVSFVNPFFVDEMCGAEKAVYTFFINLLNRAVSVHNLVSAEAMAGVISKAEMLSLTYNDVKTYRDGLAQQAAAAATKTE